MSRALVRYSISGLKYRTTVEMDKVAERNSLQVCLKKNMNAPRPSEHPPVRGEKCQNVYVGSIAENTKPLHGI